MKKTLARSLAMAFVGSLLAVGSAMALTLPTEYALISPNPIVGKPSPMVAGSGPAYFIWTDDANRTSWHISWTGDSISNNPADRFSGSIFLENNTGVFSTISFEAIDTLSVAPLGDAADFLAFATTGFDQIDFTLTNLGSPSYVGFDLKANYYSMDTKNVFLGANHVSAYSLGADEDFKIAAPVPEPASMLLLGTGLVGLAGARRRKKAAKA